MRMKLKIFYSVLLFACAFSAADLKPSNKDLPKGGEPWIYVSENSAVIYWQIEDISKEAVSYVEYGDTEACGKKTEATVQPRWSQLHWIKDLEPEKTYHYKMVTVLDGKETRSEDKTFTTIIYKDAERLKNGNPEDTFLLDKKKTTYVLTEDIITDSTAFMIMAEGITLDLNGHTVKFSKDADESAFGVHINAPNVKICNGFIVQLDKGNNYSGAINSAGAANGVEVFGIKTDVHLPNSYPMRFLNGASKLNIHHNHLYSAVEKLVSRHYPGNDLLRVDIKGDDFVIHDNLFTRGCHRGMAFHGDKPAKKIYIYNNDIKHKMMFVNGYAMQGNMHNAKIYRNKITSSGRTVHLTAANIEYFENWASTTGGMVLDDMPQNCMV